MEPSQRPADGPLGSQGRPGALVALIALTLLIGGLGAGATARGVVDWYPTLAKPFFNPPNWVFGPAWTTLYVLMACSMWLVWRSAGPRRLVTRLTFFGMLAANSLWSLLFFGLRRPDLALIDLLLYLALLVLWCLQLRMQSRLAAWLQLPHVIWVGFAGALNAAIWWLNK